MMKEQLYILLSISLLFTVYKGTLNAKPFIKTTKEQYIQRANKGDIKAMIALQNHFCFIETKEGLKLYKKWFKTIDKNDKPSDILNFTRIFLNYHDMFVNGDSKYKYLLSLLKGYASKSQVENHKKYIQEKKIRNLLKDFRRAFIYKNFDREKSLEEELLSTKEGKKALAKFYFHNDKKYIAYNLFEELAIQESDIDSIITLAVQTFLEYPYNSRINKISEKWQDYILRSNNRKLIQKTQDRLSRSYITKDDATLIKYFQEQMQYLQVYVFKGTATKFWHENNNNEKARAFLRKIADDKLVNNNIIVLREKFENANFSNKKEAIKFLEKAYDYGDIYSGFTLAQFYERKEDKHSLLKAEEIYQDLSNRSDNDAKIALAALYLDYEKLKDVNKAIKIYEDLVKENSADTLSFALRKLQLIYLSNQNYKKAFLIIQKLIKLRNDANNYTILAWMYHTGNGTKKNLQKAKKYYEIGLKKGDLTAKKYLKILNNQIQKDKK